MRVSFRTLAACGLLLVPLCCLGATGTSFNQNGFNPRILDTSVPQAERLKLFAHIIQLADQGQVRAQELAGTMYWQGSKIAGSPIQTNLVQARKLLANAAVHGDVTAMAKLAELQLKNGKTLKAMIWAQLYAHYLDPTRSARDFHGRMYAYASDLMQRIEAAGGKVSAATTSDVNGMATRFDSSIRAGIEAERNFRRSGNPHLIQEPMGTLSSADVNLNGVADFMVGFKPDGSVNKVWLLASWPTDKIGTLLRPWLQRARANHAHGNANMRYLEITITQNAHKSRSLRAHH